jgi:hypothetical protein
MNINIENTNLVDNSHSPIIIRSNNLNSSNLKNSINSNENNLNFSPFMMRNTSESKMSNSNSHSKSINMNFHKHYTPSPNVVKERLSDRFIPVNKGTNLLEKFEMAKKWENVHPEIKHSNSNQESTNMSNYSTLLESNFFGQENTNKSNLNTNLKTKIFQFKTEQKKRTNTLKLNYLFDDCSDNVQFERKINTKPYKVLDAPGLIDDFYLNLVDWSSKNDIAVGLSNIAYVWCTNKTQIVKLLEYDGDKAVSSVMWNNE